MESDKLTILVIIAALNEEAGIGFTMVEINEFLEGHSFLVVDGNSKDRTVEIAKMMGAKVILQQGAGKGSALAQAIRHVSFQGEYVVFTDADYTYPAEYIPGMIQILRQNPTVGMVTGNRFNLKHKLSSMTDPFFIGNRFLAFGQRLLNGVNLKDPLTGLRVVRWQLLKDWEPKSKGFDIEAEMNHRVERQGYKIIESPIYYRDRLGQKKLKLRHGFSIFARILLESLMDAI